VEGKFLVIKRDFQCGGNERFQEQQRDGSRDEAARDYSAGASAIYFQIFLQCIAEEEESPRGGV